MASIDLAGRGTGLKALGGKEGDLFVSEYHARFFNDPAHQAAEIEHLLNLATTNKTDFFREPGHFDVLVH